MRGDFGLPIELAYRRLQIFFGDVGEHEFSAGLSELVRELFADARARAGHDGDFVFEVFHRAVK